MKTIHFGKDIQGRVNVAPGDPLSFNSRRYKKPRVTLAPTLTGVNAVGELLTYHAGTWLDFDQITHVWYSDGMAVQFSGPTYTVDPADAGHDITVLERAINESGGASSRSAPKVIP